MTAKHNLIPSIRDNAPTGIFPGCRACLLDLAQKVSLLAAGQDEDMQHKVEAVGREIVQRTQADAMTSPELANLMLREIKKITGVADPYEDYKIREMDLARQAFQKIERNLDGDLHSALVVAALGNSLDFFRPPETALPDIESTLHRPGFFHHDDTQSLISFLSNHPHHILYLTDNAGEIYFDLPLYSHLTRLADRVTLVVKGEPALNDLTRRDLEKAGLLDQFNEIADTGTDGAGIDWANVSREFLQLWSGADLMIVKGMANFETVYPRILEVPSFYLFKVKCVPMKDYLQAPPDSFWALWRDGLRLS
jgi:damage-control phosphatase, subfamily I